MSTRIRNKKLTVWLSPEEDIILKKLAKETDTRKSTLIRCLINGYEPQNFPVTEFEEMRKSLIEINYSLRRILKCNNNEVSEEIKKELESLKEFKVDFYNKLHQANDFDITLFKKLHDK